MKINCTLSLTLLGQSEEGAVGNSGNVKDSDTEKSKPSEYHSENIRSINITRPATPTKNITAMMAKTLKTRNVGSLVIMTSLMVTFSLFIVYYNLIIHFLLDSFLFLFSLHILPSSSPQRQCKGFSMEAGI